MSTYLPGQSVTLSVTFLDPSTREALTPATIKLRVVEPTTPTPTETDTTGGFTVSSDGRYSLNVPVTTPGVWKYRWEATAPFIAAVEGAFTVSTTTFAAD